MKHVVARLAISLALVAASISVEAQDKPMGFFITSESPGDGGNLGGLEGADGHCQKLAEAVGAGGRTWRAYLSTAAVHARDRIGNGPWHNAKGDLIAQDLAELHGDAAGLNKQTALTEAGAVVNGRGDTPNMHDILTGSNPDGTLAAGMTCNDWTSNSADDKAFVGHHDRIGRTEESPAKSWNSSHPSRGCGKDDLPKSGGNGLFYCFAAD